LTLQLMKPTWEQRLHTLAKDALSFSNDMMRPAGETVQAEVLREANQVCEAITAQNSRSFYLATSLLPAAKRQAMRALYAFCRTADNLADGNAEMPEHQLSILRAGIRGSQKSPQSPVLIAWADIFTRYQIPLHFAEQLLDGVECDLVQHRFNSFEDLSVYCYNVASTVGLMSMYITGFSSQEAVSYAIKLGVALQLTNILRDVGEDWLAGRLYLPMEELKEFGLDEEDVASQKIDGRWRAFMRFQISRARSLYAEALPGIAMLHPDGRFAVTAAAGLYKGILDDIERHDFAVFTRRAYVSRGLKLKILLEAFWFTQKIRLRQLKDRIMKQHLRKENDGN
jgi:15-cis-phytoene synthase